MAIELDVTVTCPQCGFIKQEQMPPDTGVVLYECTSCGARLRPLAGVCCVFCSFGDRHCPSRQRGDQNKSAEVGNKKAILIQLFRTQTPTRTRQSVSSAVYLKS